MEWETFLVSLKESNGEMEPLSPVKTKLNTKTRRIIPCKMKPFRKCTMENENTIIEQRYHVFEFKLLLCKPKE
jgi:hypothetical protein